jgi:hypothetical protein
MAVGARGGGGQESSYSHEILMSRTHDSQDLNHVVHLQVVALFVNLRSETMAMVPCARGGGEGGQPTT